MTSRFTIALVTLYLALVALWLLATRQIEAPGLGKILRSALRGRYRAELSGIQAEAGRCWVAQVPDRLLSDKEAASRLVVFEDGHALGPGHASHGDIRELGAGRYSHWGATVYFSTPDNSDPRTNGRRYSVAEMA